MLQHRFSFNNRLLDKTDTVKQRKRRAIKDIHNSILTKIKNDLIAYDFQLVAISV